MCLLEGGVGDELVLDVLYVQLVLPLNRLETDYLTVIEVERSGEVISTDFKHHLSLLAILLPPQLLLGVDIIHLLLLLLSHPPLILNIKPYSRELILERPYTNIHVLHSLIINKHRCI